MSENLLEAPQGEFVLFRSEDTQAHVKCRFESDTLWLSQAEIANLYQVTPQAITQHVKVIYEEGEFVQNSTCESFLQVRQEGNRQVNRNTLHYNLSVELK